MRLRSALLSATVAVGVLFAPSAAHATAWGYWTYELTVGVQGVWTNFCVRAGMVDTNRNYVDMQTRANAGGAGCNGAAQNVPAGYLGGDVDGYINGGYCGSSNTLWSGSATWGYSVSASVCGNPPGLQSFYTVGTGYIFNDGSKGGAVGNNAFSQRSPSQNY